jgi:hypothetical protein
MKRRLPWLIVVCGFLISWTPSAWLLPAGCWWMHPIVFYGISNIPPSYQNDRLIALLSATLVVIFGAAAAWVIYKNSVAGALALSLSMAGSTALAIYLTWLGFQSL